MRGNKKQVDNELIFTKYGSKKVRLLNCSKSNTDFENEDVDATIDTSDLEEGEGFYCFMENEEDEIVISGKTGKSYKVVKKANDTYEITKDNAAPITKNKDDEDTFDGVQITLGSVEGTTNIVNGIADYANYNTGPDEPIIIRGTLNGHQSTISVEDVNNSFLFEGKTVIGSDAANDHSVEFLQHEY